jgi:hypothetical protein
VNRGVKPTTLRPASVWLRRIFDALKKLTNWIGLGKNVTPQDLVDLAHGAAHSAIRSPIHEGNTPTRFSSSTGSAVLDAGIDRREKAHSREGDRPLSKKIADWFGGSMKDHAEGFNVHVVDNTASVKSTLQEAGDTESIMHLAFASKAADAAVTSMLHGPLVLDPKTNAFRATEDKNASLRAVHEQVQLIAKKFTGGNAKDNFANASRAFDLGGILLRERSLPPDEQGKFKFSPDDIRAGEEALRLYGTEIRAGMDAWTTYKNALLDAAQKAGRFSAEDVAEWKKAADYVPWFRVLDDAKFGHETKTSAKQFFKGLQDSGKMRELVGGSLNDRPIGDLLNNMETLSFWIANATIKNHTANKVLDSLVKIDARKLPSRHDPTAEQNRIVQTYRNGEQTFYEVGNKLDTYAFMGVEDVTSPVIRTLAQGANLLRRGTTLMPGFVASQLFQDAFRVTLYSGAKSPFKVGARTFTEFARELQGFTKKQTDKGDALTHHLAAYGIIGRPDYIFEDEKSRVRAGLNETKTGVRRAANAAFGMLGHLTHASDAAQRRAIYKQTLEETGNESLALYKAIEIINFQTRGANGVISQLRHIIPFFNAYIQGMSVSLRSLAGTGISLRERSDALRTFYATAAKITALSLLYSMLVSDDKEYQETADHVKMTGFIIPGTRKAFKDAFGVDLGANLKIPAPVDPAGLLFKIIPETTYNYAVRKGTENEIDNTKFLRQLRAATIQAVSSPNLTPQAVKPIIEGMTNYDFFTQSPIVGRGLQHLETEKQFTSSTTEMAKMLGQFLPMAPVQIDHLVRGILGTAGSTAMFGASAIIDGLTPGERPSSRWNEVPQVRTFLTGKATSGLKEDFYELRDKAMTVGTTVNWMKIREPEQLREYIEKNKELYAIQKSGAIAKIDKALSQLREYQNRVDADKKMSAEEKRDLLNQYEAREVELLSKVNLSALRRLSGL